MRDFYSMEAEQGVLGAILIRPELADILTRDLLKSDFYFSDNQQVYQAIVTLVADSKPIDIITVAEVVGSFGEGESPLPYLDQLYRNTPSAANAKAYAQIVKERATDRSLQLVATEIHDIVHSDEQLESKIAQVQALANGIDAKSATQETVDAGEVVKRHIQELERRAALDGQLDGLSTGIDALDDLLGGLKPGQVIVIAGRPKMGKTTLAMNIASHNALHKDKSVLVVSLEMQDVQLMDKVIASEGHISLSALKAGKLSQDQWDALGKTSTLIEKSGLALSKKRSTTMSGARSMFRRFKHDNGLDLGVIDHIGLLEGETPREKMIDIITNATRTAKLMAMEMGVPFIILSQLSRALEARPDKRPVPSDLRDSGTIEQDADMIVFVYRDEVYNPNTEYRGTAELILGAARDMPTGMCRVQYQGNYSSFSDLSDGWTPTSSSDFASRAPAGKRGLDLD